MRVATCCRRTRPVNSVNQEGAADMGKLSTQTRDKLKKISTATLTTALFKRGFMHQMIQDVHPLNPQALPMVGEAFTLRYIPADRKSTRLNSSHVSESRMPSS